MDKVVIKTKNIDYKAQEAIRGLRSFLENGVKDGNVIAFTSVVAKEGKSFVTFQTASAMAASGKTCVYVNANLREAVAADIYEASGIKNTLAAYLEGKCSMEACVCETSDKNLYIVEAGAPCKNAPELLATEAYDNLIKYLGKEYDYVLIDTPAVGVVSDALVVGSRANEVILVMETETVPYEQAQKVKKQFEMNNCKVAGVVLNK